MMVICTNVRANCVYEILETAFEVESLDKGVCPRCGGSVAPAWVRNHRTMREMQLRRKRIKLLRELNLVDDVTNE